ncbi:MAG: excinuclease ABC subunit UvrA, partial [Acidimicrobiales bacterium]
FEEPEPRNFSFNSPYGACPTCDGLGTQFEVDPELVVPDPSRSLANGALTPWAGGRSRWFERMLEAVADEQGFSTKTRWDKLKKADQKIVLYGTGAKKVQLKYRNRQGRQRSFVTHYEGVVPWLQRRHAESDSEAMREWTETFMREVPCAACGGSRLKPESLAVTIGDRSIHELCSLSITAASAEVDSMKLTEREHLIADRVLREVQVRLRFLLDVGLDYLSMTRGTATLSGGEAQRIRLASQIGSGLVGVLYVLDEPSIGLHQRDNARLLDTLIHLRDLGNTVIVVEHDEDAIRHADYVLDMGPGAGVHGGRVVAQGRPAEVIANPASLTGQYLAGRRRIETPSLRLPFDRKRTLRIRGARGNNLKNIDVDIPLGLMTCITGVSGSGKSTMVNDTLYRYAARKLNDSSEEPAACDGLEGLEQIDKVIDID